MPKKKGKKSGKSGKGKKGGKKAGKKGEKSAAKKESVVKDAIANAKLWETKLFATERSRVEYRENCKRLLYENDMLQSQMGTTEKDTIEVISFLKNEDMKKDDQIVTLQQALKELKKESKKEKEVLVENYSQQLEQLKEALDQKNNEVKLMQSELKLVKEFRRKRAQMQKELDEIKENVFYTDKMHQETLSQMEHKFFEEKIRLQQEASKKIAELAEKAHSEAVSNLDETTRSVYKENVRVNEALQYHVKEGGELKKVKEKLEKENKDLAEEKELNGMIVQEKVVVCKQQKELIKELSEKVQTLEQSLSHVVKEFEQERLLILNKADSELKNSRAEISRLKRVIELKTKEMSRVKLLAKNILDQRTEMEQFFMDSLELVKKEIARNRTQYRKDAETAYWQKMLLAHQGKGDYPKVRTFKPTETSTNSVYQDMREAENWNGMDGKVDISDLTWEQRERVLRLLFAKMNGFKDRRMKKHIQQLEDKETQDVLSLTDGNTTAITDKENTFLTQTTDFIDSSQELPPQSAGFLPSITAADQGMTATAVS